MNSFLFSIFEKFQQEAKPTIVTAADRGYMDPLEASIFYIHRHFSDFNLIVYDLGLTSEQYKKIKTNCRCEIRKFDENQKYSKMYPHVLKLKNYAWKPLIIQVNCFIKKNS